MKSIKELRSELKSQLFLCTTENNGSLASRVNENIQWAWDNWSIDFTEYYEGDQQPEVYTKSFCDEWIDNEDFEVELEMINEN